jgi:hypothetical protein
VPSTAFGIDLGFNILYISLLLRCERISHCCGCDRGIFGSQRLQTSQKQRQGALT